MPDAQIYEFGEFRVDAAKRTLTNREDQQLPLTHKAFDTLLYLLRNSGRVLDKQELMNAVWPDTVVEENNLNQCISALRRVFGEGRGEHRFIQTLPGRGYRFIAEIRTISGDATIAPASVKKTIAVLPFKPLVEENRDAALEIGMADTLIARLSVGEVIVRPISSVYRYCDLDQDPLAVGRELRVESVLDGSIQRWGDKIRVNARLMNVDTGLSLWAGTFDREFRDIFDIQDEISLAIVDALMVKLFGWERATVLKHSTENTEAYELYLKGRFFWYRFNLEGMAKARHCFEQALEKDPDFALAHSGLADALSASSVFVAPKEVYPKAKQAALQALKLDSSISEAWISQAAVKFFYEWDWAGAERDCKHSIELNPRYVLARDLYSLYLLSQARFEEAIRQARISLELDPLSGHINSSLGIVLHYYRRFDEAADYMLKAVELDPGNLWSLARLVDLLEETGNHSEALNYRQKLLSVVGNRELAEEIGRQFQRHGYRGVLLKWLDELRKQSRLTYTPPIEFARIFVQLGDEDQAMDWLEAAFEDRTLFMGFLKVAPIWDSLHSNARYARLLSRMELSD
jgi:serine/threonine-protein kinase